MWPPAAPPPKFSSSRPLGVGDRCVVKSGGPEMLVVDVFEGAVVCSWRSAGDPFECTFSRDVLVRVGS